MVFGTQFEETIIALIANAVPRRFRKVRIEPDMRLQSDLGIDSLGIVGLLFHLEELFGVDLEAQAADLDISQIRTVRDVIDLIRRLIDRKSGGQAA